MVNLNLVSGSEKFFDFDKFSSLNKIYRILSIVIKFCNKCRKIENDSNKQARIFAIKLMQKQQFPEEIHFLKFNRKNKNIPDLIIISNSYIAPF